LHVVAVVVLGGGGSQLKEEMVTTAHRVLLQMRQASMLRLSLISAIFSARVAHSDG
jgi:hypothetical protein